MRLNLDSIALAALGAVGSFLIKLGYDAWRVKEEMRLSLSFLNRELGNVDKLKKDLDEAHDRIRLLGRHTGLEFNARDKS